MHVFGQRKPAIYDDDDDLPAGWGDGEDEDDDDVGFATAPRTFTNGAPVQAASAIAQNTEASTVRPVGADFVPDVPGDATSRGTPTAASVHPRSASVPPKPSAPIAVPPASRGRPPAAGTRRELPLLFTNVSTGATGASASAKPPLPPQRNRLRWTIHEEVRRPTKAGGTHVDVGNLVGADESFGPAQQARGELEVLKLRKRKDVSREETLQQLEDLQRRVQAMAQANAAEVALEDDVSGYSGGAAGAAYRSLRRLRGTVGSNASTSGSIAGQATPETAPTLSSACSTDGGQSSPASFPVSRSSSCHGVAAPRGASRANPRGVGASSGSRQTQTSRDGGCSLPDLVSQSRQRCFSAPPPTVGSAGVGSVGHCGMGTLPRLACQIDAPELLTRT
eukprot:TRINITY_DN30472_c0_g1_i1.p1 TRINITY_DN30472_c0_g1~~TRINITY_DN30472_c0_g1_i1.p1  ORF type:complete len:393 (-),score=73.20 TRINITY_DN30472_c0_g1_i1:78-1256(-)